MIRMATTFKLSSPEASLCEVLTACDQNERIDAVQRFIKGLGDEKAFLFSHGNGVSSIVAHVLMDAYGVENVPMHWVRDHEENRACISRYLKELDRIAERFAGEGIKLVALKNGGIARGIYPCLGCCPMGDVDVLIEKSCFRRAHQILLNDGYRFDFRSPLEEANLDEAEKSGGSEYWKKLSDGTKLWFELQWRAVSGRWIRPDQEPDTNELMDRSIAISGTNVRLLSPEDNLIQVTLHTAKHSYVRAPGFRLHLDVVRIVEGQIIDWDIFVKRVMKLQVKTPVFYSLLIPKILFKTPIPEEVLEHLKPHSWKMKGISKWLHKIGLFNPNEKKFTRMGYIIFNALLYDDLTGLWHGIFPDEEWMMERYGTETDKGLVSLYLKRLMDLTFRRVNT